MLEPEVAFATLDDVVQLAEECVRHVCEGVLLTCEEDLEFFNKRVDTSLLQRLQKMAQGARRAPAPLPPLRLAHPGRCAAAEPFQRMTYTEAVRELKKSGQEFAYPVGQRARRRARVRLTRSAAGGVGVLTPDGARAVASRHVVPRHPRVCHALPRGHQTFLHARVRAAGGGGRHGGGHGPVGSAHGTSVRVHACAHATRHSHAAPPHRAS